jgi:hypothetical protein
MARRRRRERIEDNHKEDVMRSHQPTLVVVMLALVASAVILVPADPFAAERSRPAAVSIPAIKSVAGRWSGILYGRPGGERARDWIELALQEDGTYTFASPRTYGVFSGSGTVGLADGRLIAEGEQARVTFTLYQGGGKRFLRAEGTMASGQPLRADLYPAR